MNIRDLMTRITVLVCVLGIFLTAPDSYARSCNSYERDKAEHFAEKAVGNLISKYGGGQDERFEISEYNINSYSGKYKLKIEIYWNGIIIRSNQYNIDGVLEFESDGSNAVFSQTYANQNVKDLKLWGTIAGGTILLGILASEVSSVSDNGYSLHFTNHCCKTLRLAIHFKNLSTGEWETRGYWVFAPGESAYLLSSSQRLKTNNATLYYSVVPEDGSYINFKTDYSFDLRGNTLKMKKITDESGDTEWSYSCS